MRDPNMIRPMPHNQKIPWLRLDTGKINIRRLRESMHEIIVLINDELGSSDP